MIMRLYCGLLGSTITTANTHITEGLQYDRMRLYCGLLGSPIPTLPCWLHQHVSSLSQFAYAGAVGLITVSILSESISLLSLSAFCLLCPL